jgi:hypothetical protein
MQIGACLGVWNTTAPIAGCPATAPAWWRFAKTCRRSTTLGPSDSNGIPAPRISYRLSENSRRMLDHAVERGSEIRHGSAMGGKPTFAYNYQPSNQ